jgi:hypothetical protein
MEIKITKPPLPGIVETICKDCGREILLLKTPAEAQAVLDERPGPYRIELCEDGIHRAVHRSAVDGYMFHFEGGCVEAEAAAPEPTKFDKLALSLEATAGQRAA